MGGEPVDTVGAVIALQELARRCDRYVWFERTASEVLGTAARSDSHTARRAVLAMHGAHHAWHVELWTVRRPALFAPAEQGAGLADLAAALDVDGVYGVLLPALADVYRAHRSDVDPRLDAPTARCLDLVLADLTADLAAVERVGFTGGSRRAVTDLLAAAGGIAGS